MDERKKIKLIIGGIALFIIIMLVILFFPIVVVGAGQRGVVFNNSSGVEDRVLGEGMHIRIPFVENVTMVSVRVQKTDIKADAASKDLQTVTTDIVVNWHLDSAKVNKIYQQVGDEKAIVDRVLTPAVSEVVKAATAQKTAEELLAKRAQLKTDIDAKLEGRLLTYNVILDDVSIINIQFSPQFNAAIEAKQVAQQQAQQAIFNAEKAKNDAEATINRSRGEAEGQRLQQLTLTEPLLQKMAIEKWDGKFPQYFGGGVLPFLSIK